MAIISFGCYGNPNLRLQTLGGDDTVRACVRACVCACVRACVCVCVCVRALICWLWNIEFICSYYFEKVMMSLVCLQTETIHTICMHKHKKYTHIIHNYNISFVHYRLLLVPSSHKHTLVKAISCGWHWCLCSLLFFVKSRTENTCFFFCRHGQSWLVY